MNIVFLTVSRVGNITDRTIYCDLLREFKAHGHDIWVVYPRERQFGKSTEYYLQEGINMIGVRTLNIQKTNVVEKGLATLSVEVLFGKAIRKYMRQVRLDLILYTTPPITFTHLIKSLKKNNPNAVSYLLLKDIFPQNAVDLGMFTQNSLFYKYFRRQERLNYLMSDHIGCMSPSNVEYIKEHNTYISTQKIEVAPNSVMRPLLKVQMNCVQRNNILSKYNIPSDRIVFVYGGNIGKPQGIDFVIKCLEANKNRTDCFFVVVGNGTEFKKLEAWFLQNQDKNLMLLPRLPKEDYDRLVQACDVGLIFLDYRFTIPNYPSRLLTYLEYGIPVICATDSITDIGRIAEKNGYGFWCESLKEIDFTMLVDRFVNHPELIPVMGERGYDFLCKNYTVENTYRAIMKHFETSPSTS